VLNYNPNFQTHGFWNAQDSHEHITWKELRVVRHTTASFLPPQLPSHNVLLRENNTAVVAILTKLDTRSHAMMAELRRL
jgi:hypothetical protein